MNKLKGYCQAVSGSELVFCKIVIGCMKTCVLKMLDFYENVKGFVKAVLIVKSHHLHSNVRTVDLSLVVILVGNGYVQLNSQIYACTCFKTENKIVFYKLKVLSTYRSFCTCGLSPCIHLAFTYLPDYHVLINSARLIIVLLQL